jgi:hypothetical protein
MTCFVVPRIHNLPEPKLNLEEEERCTLSLWITTLIFLGNHNMPPRSSVYQAIGVSVTIIYCSVVCELFELTLAGEFQW